MIDKIYNWMKTNSGLCDIQPEWVDHTPGGSGLFYRGQTVQERHLDLLGGCCCRKRVKFSVKRYGEPAESPEFFEKLAHWVTQSPPAFGRDQTVSLRDAHLVREDGSGLALWEADLEITFMEDV